MKRLDIPYPVILAAYPAVAVYAENQSILSPVDLIRPVAVSVLAAGLLWTIVSLVLRDAKRGAAATTVLLSGFSVYNRTAPYFGVDTMPAVGNIFWLACLLALAGLAAWKWRWHSVVGFFSIVLFLLPLVKIGAFQSSLVGSRVMELAAGHKSGPKPDVVYIILDGYGRTDTFERFYGFSDRLFVDSLRKRGFYVADRSRANFCQTELSVASALNMEYVQDLDSLGSPPAGVRPTFKPVIEQNAVMGEFKSMGYLIGTVGTGFPALTFRKTEVDQPEEGGLNLLENALLQKTPLAGQKGIWDSQFARRHRMIHAAFARLSSLGGRGSQPRFTFVHFLAPHPPFSFGENGEELRPPGPFGLWDGSDYMTFLGDAKAYRKGYSDQAKYVGKEILKSLDRILDTKGIRPIIIIQGDHGPKMHLDQNSLARTDVDEVFPILNAYLVPDEVKKHLYPEITPVNTFRTILREAFGKAYPRLPDKSWYSPYEKPLEFTEVSVHASTKRA